MKLFTGKICLIAILIVATGFELTSVAQCSCTPLNETFGSTTDCIGFDQANTNAGIVNHTPLAYAVGGKANSPEDGGYSIRCDGDELNFGWHGQGGSTFSDHTTDPAGESGFAAVVNSGAGPREYYRTTLNNLCPGATYNLTYYAGNMTRDDNYGSLVSLGAWTFPDATSFTDEGGNVKSGTFTGTGGTLLGNTGIIPSESSATGFVWNTYSYDFTLGGAQTEIDIVLASYQGNNAGSDFAVDDISVSIVSSGSGCTLPVDLLSFNAEKFNQDAFLTWTTTDEKDFSYFSVQKSENGFNNYTEIGVINGKGTSSSPSNYHFTDTDFDATSYYRLKMVDIDGTQTYSKVVALDKEIDKVEIYPKPVGVNSTLHIDLQSSERKLEKVEVYSLSGQLISTTEAKEKSSIEISTLNMAKGLYFARIYTSEAILTEKIVVE